MHQNSQNEKIRGYNLRSRTTEPQSNSAINPPVTRQASAASKPLILRLSLKKRKGEEEKKVRMEWM